MASFRIFWVMSLNGGKAHILSDNDDLTGRLFFGTVVSLYLPLSSHVRLYERYISLFLFIDDTINFALDSGMQQSFGLINSKICYF
jgi:hypothetical protein